MKYFAKKDITLTSGEIFYKGSIFNSNEFFDPNVAILIENVITKNIVYDVPKKGNQEIIEYTI